METIVATAVVKGTIIVDSETMDVAIGAFVAMDEYQADIADAGIWLYKPIALVPEPGAHPMLLTGLAMIIWVARRRLARSKRSHSRFFWVNQNHSRH